MLLKNISWETTQKMQLLPPPNQPSPQRQQAPNPAHQSTIINLWWAYDEPKGQKKAKIKVNSGIREGGRLLIFSYTKLLQRCGLTPINITDKWWKHWSSWFGWLIHTCSGKGSLPCAFGPLDVLQEDSCCSVLETFWKNWVSRAI